MLKDEEINEIIITYMDDYSSTMLDMCRSVERAANSESDNFIKNVEAAVKNSIENIESGNDYKGLIMLKAIELSFQIRKKL